MSPQTPSGMRPVRFPEKAASFMGRIHQLPLSVVNRIAAGEVVERPASVVKELLENALDAGPTRIDVALEQGGIALVRVVDDGCGIEADDLLLAVAPHATSKLACAEDLERIGTLGFRGEALASIGEVARLVIRSRPSGGPGARLEVDGGRIGEVTPDGCALGTTVEVHQLFGNVPARRSFLRAPHTEWSHAAEAFVRTTLAHPAIAFSLRHNGRVVHDLPPATGWRERIGGLFGADLAGRLFEVEADDGEVAVHGLVSRPDDDVAGTKLQHLFVAGRPFRDRAIMHAIQEAYRGLLLSGRQPVVFLWFDLPPDMVDVNVHPAKVEVRFRDPSRLYRLVLQALRSRFLTADVRGRLAPPTTWGTPAAPTATAWEADDARATAVATPPSAPRSAIDGPRLPGFAAAAAGPAAAADEFAVQMHDRYIVVESRDGIEVIDQHALHERVLYERFKAAVAAGGLEVQPLLVPEQVELSPAEIELVHEHAGTLATGGMKVEPFGGGTVIVSSKPVLAGSTSAAVLLREVVDRLAATAAAGSRGGVLVDEVLHGLACRAAIKAGDSLSQAEVDALVRDRRLVPESHHCPHGRPTSLTLSRQELDRQFRRT